MILHFLRNDFIFLICQVETMMLITPCRLVENTKLGIVKAALAQGYWILQINCILQNSQVEVLTLHVTVLGDGVLKEITDVK